jgi:hypothetical protein
MMETPRTRHCNLGMLLAGFLLLNSCSSLKELPGQFSQVVSTQAATEQSEYSRVLSEWTRSGSIYNQLDTELLITATYHSQSFRRAYVAAYARAYHLNDNQKEDLWHEQLSQAQEFYEFLVAAYVPESDWNDFASPRSSWRLLLEVDHGEQVAPLEIRRIRKVTQLISSFYPYVQPWEMVYKVKFAARGLAKAPFPEPGDETLTLVVSNPRGTARLIWQLGAGKESRPVTSGPEGGDSLVAFRRDQLSLHSSN